MDCVTPAPVARRPQFYSTSSIADFGYTDPTIPTRYSPGHRHKTGRKTWKSLKEKKEPVWPDFLEEALLEALERYRPTSSKDPRSLRRFPKRNAYISNYIKQKTGEARTPKQVGSRLQQLRETCTEEKVIRLICSRDFDAPDRVAASRAPAKSVPDLRIDTTHTISASLSSGTECAVTPSMSIESLTLVDPYDYPVTPHSDEFDIRSTLSSALAHGNSWPHAYVHIDLVPSGEHYGTGGHEVSTSFTLDLDESGLTDTPVLSGPNAWKWQRRILVSTAIPACYYTPSVTVSSSILSSEGQYESVFRVQRDQKTLFEESTSLEYISEGVTRPSLFRTTFLPKFWARISTKESDFRQSAVIQDIYDISGHPSERSIDPIYSIIYSFDVLFSLENTTVDSLYFSASPTYPEAVLPEERVPLAPVITNPTYSPELLQYDYDTNDINNLLPSSLSAPGEHPTPTSHWMTPIYLANSYYPANSYDAMAQEQTGHHGYLEADQVAYPTLYPF